MISDNDYDPRMQALLKERQELREFLQYSIGLQGLPPVRVETLKRRVAWLTLHCWWLRQQGGREDAQALAVRALRAAEKFQEAFQQLNHE